MDVPTVEPGFEIVHFVLGYYDGVLVGIADWQGTAHHFEHEDFGPAGEPRDCFRLTPLPPEVFRAAVDAWEIWCRWQRAHSAGQIAPSAGPNPALPEDETRRREADRIVDDWLVSSSAASFVSD